MKLTKLSLITALAMSAAFAGGDIEPVVAPEVVAEYPQTTIGGKLTAYYYTDDVAPFDLFDEENSALGFAATLDVTHKFNQYIALNFSAVGFANAIDDGLYFEQEKSGAFFNVANITATFADTTLVLGRQLLDTPMLGGFDWLLGQGAFEAYTAVNSSVENLTLVGSYIRTWRPNNSGTEFIDISNDLEDHNWALGAAYDNKTISASAWYYNVDAAKYTQIYVDGGYDFTVAKINAQYVNTAWDFMDDSNAYGAKVSATFGMFSVMGAYDYIADSVVGYVGRDGLYTSSWNTLALSQGHTAKIEAAVKYSGLTASLSYAYYEYEQYNTPTVDVDGNEIDVILGYNITDTIDVNVVYTNTTADYTNFDAVNALEVYANYKF